MRYIILFLLSIFLSHAPAYAAKKSDCAAGAPIINRLHHRQTMTVLAEGRGPAIILIPGLVTPREVWAKTVASLRGCYRLHIVQIQGFGDAPGRNADGPILDKFISDLATYIETEIIAPKYSPPADEPPLLIGHSLGGLAAMRLALDHPKLVKRAMVVDSLPFFGMLFGPSVTVESIKPRAASLRDSIAAQAVYQIDERTLQTMSINQEGRDQVARWSATANPKAAANMLYDLMTTDIRPRLSELAVPITILYPADANAMPTKRFDAFYRSAYASNKKIALKRIDKSRHFIMLDQPDKFHKAIDIFLKS